jgi:putative transposase
MSHRTSYNILGQAHFLTFSCWQRQPFLSDREACISLARTLNEARQRERFGIWAYVLMPEHVHLLIYPRSETYDMAKILRRIKEPTARQMLSAWRETNSP